MRTHRVMTRIVFTCLLVFLSVWFVIPPVASDSNLYSVIGSPSLGQPEASFESLFGALGSIQQNFTALDWEITGNDAAGTCETIATKIEQRLSFSIGTLNSMRAYMSTLNQSRLSAPRSGDSPQIVLSDGKGLYYNGSQWTTQPLDATRADRKHDLRFQSWFAYAATGPKDIVILLDNSESVGFVNYGPMRPVLVEAALSILQALTPADRVSIILFADTCVPLGGTLRMMDATRSHVASLTLALNNLPAPAGGTNLGLALTTAQSLLRTSNISNCLKAVVVLSDGTPTTGLTVNLPRVYTETNVRIFSYANLHPMDLLQQIACVSGATYRPISARETSSIANVASVFTILSAHTNRTNVVHWSHTPRETIIAAKPFFANGLLVGVMAVETPLRDVLLGLPLGFNAAMYSFMMDQFGIIIFHPLVNGWETGRKYLADCEKEISAADRVTLLDLTYRWTAGAVTFNISASSIATDSMILYHRVYYWRKIRDTDFLLVTVDNLEFPVVSLGSSNSLQNVGNALYSRMLDKPINFVYPLRLIPQPGYPVPVSLDKPTILFPPIMYYDYIAYMNGSLSNDAVTTSINDWLYDPSLTSSPLMEGARQSAWLTSPFDHIWSQAASLGGMQPLWRFVATASGVYRIFPGRSFERTYDARTTAWFKSTLNAPRNATVISHDEYMNLVLTRQLYVEDHLGNEDFYFVVGVILKNSHAATLLSEYGGDVCVSSDRCFLLDQDAAVVAANSTFDSMRGSLLSAIEPALFSALQNAHLAACPCTGPQFSPVSIINTGSFTGCRSGLYWMSLVPGTNGVVIAYNITASSYSCGIDPCLALREQSYIPYLRGQCVQVTPTAAQLESFRGDSTCMILPVEIVIVVLSTIGSLICLVFTRRTFLAGMLSVYYGDAPTGKKMQAPVVTHNAVLSFSDGPLKSRARLFNTAGDDENTSAVEATRAIIGETYSGDTVSEMKHGKGTCRYANGNEYTGDWRFGLRHGRGECRYGSGENSDVYDGEWDSDRPNGKGTYTSKFGWVYEGLFRNSQFHGIGRISYTDGTYYDGEWFNGQRHGRGTERDLSGSIFQGTFVGDCRSGPGALTQELGRVTAGIWKGDSFVRPEGRRFDVGSTMLTTTESNLRSPMVDTDAMDGDDDFSEKDAGVMMGDGEETPMLLVHEDPVASAPSSPTLFRKRSHISALSGRKEMSTLTPRGGNTHTMETVSPSLTAQTAALSNSIDMSELTVARTASSDSILSDHPEVSDDDEDSPSTATITNNLHPKLLFEYGKVGISMENLTPEARWSLAAGFVRDAMQLRDPSLRIGKSPAQIRIYKFYSHPVVNAVYWIVTFVYCLGFPFFEPTSWRECISLDSTEKMILYIELAIIGFLLIDEFLRFSHILVKYSHTTHKYTLQAPTRQSLDTWRAVTLLTELVLGAVAAMILAGAPGIQFIRWVRSFRAILMICRTSALRLTVGTMLTALPRTIQWACLVLIALFLYGVLGHDMYQYLESEVGFATSYGYTINGVMSAFLLMNTINYPNVMYPGVRWSSWTVLFYVSFLVFVMYFLLSYFLAAIHDSYRNVLKEQALRDWVVERLALIHAFTVLDHDQQGELPKWAWVKLVTEELKWEHEEAYKLFSTIDKNQTDSIDMAQFLYLGDIHVMGVKTSMGRIERLKEWSERMGNKVNSKLPESWVDEETNTFKLVLLMQKITNSPWYHAIIVSRVIAVIIYAAFSDSFTSLTGHLVYDRLSDAMSILFACAYFMEMMAAPNAMGFLFDPCADLILIAVCGAVPPLGRSFFVYSESGGYIGWNWVRGLQIIRLLRRFEWLRKFSQTFLSTIWVLCVIMALTALIVYMSAVIGVEAFSDVVFDTSGVPGSQFTTIGDSLIMQLQLLINQNWDTVLDGTMRLSSPWSAVYFITFNFLIVEFMVNFVIAHILEMFHLFQREKDDTTGARLKIDLEEPIDVRTEITAVSRNEYAVKKIRVKPRRRPTVSKILQSELDAQVAMDALFRTAEARGVGKVVLSLDTPFATYWQYLRERQEEIHTENLRTNYRRTVGLGGHKSMFNENPNPEEMIDMESLQRAINEHLANVEGHKQGDTKSTEPGMRRVDSADSSSIVVFPQGTHFDSPGLIQSQGTSRVSTPRVGWYSPGVASPGLVSPRMHSPRIVGWSPAIRQRGTPVMSRAHSVLEFRFVVADEDEILSPSRRHESNDRFN